MPVLIDGYNLLFALGRLTTRTPREALQGARRWLLSQLRSRHLPDEEITVVFDGGAAVSGARSRDDQLGIRVVFSHRESADDVIEDMIQATKIPARLTVVSNDHRLQQAARKRGCVVLDCLNYYERDRQTPQKSQVTDSLAKPEAPSPQEIEGYLEAFKDLGDDPLLKDPY